jgi:hypothetical protein
MDQDSGPRGQKSIAQAQRRPWSPPRVILSELRKTYHQAGKAPSDKINFSTDAVTPSGSSGS